MTIINNIEIDTIRKTRNEMKDAILNNDPVEEALHVIIVVSNASQFASRYILAREFIHRVESQDSHVLLYVVELAYVGQKFHLTEPDNPRHLRLRSTDIMWHKENLINVGVRRLFPSSWKAMAWVDADLEFENAHWALDTLKILNGCRDIVQLFSHCVDMDPQGVAMRVFQGFGYMYTLGHAHGTSGINFWHPGFAWACTRRAYERMGGLFQMGILGSGDHIMSLAVIGRGRDAIHRDSSVGYLREVLGFERRCRQLRLGYIPGTIRHHFHGHKKDRGYQDRWSVLLKHGFDPLVHVEARELDGLLTFSPAVTTAMKVDMKDYFRKRNEDAGRR